MTRDIVLIGHEQERWHSDWTWAVEVMNRLNLDKIGDALTGQMYGVLTVHQSLALDWSIPSGSRYLELWFQFLVPEVSISQFQSRYLEPWFRFWVLEVSISQLRSSPVRELLEILWFWSSLVTNLKNILVLVRVQVEILWFRPCLGKDSTGIVQVCLRYKMYLFVCTLLYKTIIISSMLF